ncbi:MAG: TRAP transporter large permease subunit [Alphaproteobacteria bacterium]|nr:TRAP transporter large permease subunit [Alphaproteobacteria bacterium]
MELIFLALLFLLMMYALGSGYPVAFALPGSAIVTIVLAGLTGLLIEGDSSAYFIQDGPVEWLTAGVTNFRGIYWEVERDTLIAIPLFIFMGIMLQRSKIAEDLLVTMAQLFGPIPGGLGISVVFVGGLLAATTGIVGATVVAMGLISLPAMLRNNYSQSLATGTICASGTLGQIIPPSIVLIILADQLASAADQAATMRKDLYKQATGQFSMPSEFNIISTSAGDMFLGAFLPGITLVALYMAYILVAALIRPKIAPAVPYEGKLLERSFLLKVALALFPPLLLIFLVLGSIIAGIATVNQAGAIGAIGAMLMAGYKLREGTRAAFYPAVLTIASLLLIWLISSNFNLSVKTISKNSDWIGLGVATLGVIGLLAGIAWSGWRAYTIEDTLTEVMKETAKTTSLVFIILLGAAMLTSAFRGFGGEEVVKHFLSSLPGGFWAQFIVVMLVIFLLGFFLDFIEIAVVVVPIVAPILLADPSANITAVWLGVMIGLNIQTSFLTPPFGFALFYLRGVASKAVKTINMYKGVIPFIALQLVGLAIVGFNPALVNYLPTKTFLSSETAPPPKNPRLQLCLEDYLFEFYANNETAYNAELDRLKAADLSVLPPAKQQALALNIRTAGMVFDLVADIKNAKSAMADAAISYAPVHTEVRSIERGIRQGEAEIKQLQRELRATDRVSKRNKIQSRIAALKDDIASQRTLIPSSWQNTNRDFKKLTAQLNGSRVKMRRQSDQAYADIRLMVTSLETETELTAIGETVRQIREDMAAVPPADLLRRVKTSYNDLDKIPDVSDAVKALSDARSVLNDPSPDRQKATAMLDATLAIIDRELAWRSTAKTTLYNELSAFESFARFNLGLREQERLTPEQVDIITPCLAQHRNLALQF